MLWDEEVHMKMIEIMSMTTVGKRLWSIYLDMDGCGDIQFESLSKSLTFSIGLNQQNSLGVLRKFRMRIHL